MKFDRFLIPKIRRVLANIDERYQPVVAVSSDHTLQSVKVTFEEELPEIGWVVHSLVFEIFGTSDVQPPGREYGLWDLDHFIIPKASMATRYLDLDHQPFEASDLRECLRVLRDQFCAKRRLTVKRYRHGGCIATISFETQGDPLPTETVVVETSRLVNVFARHGGLMLTNEYAIPPLCSSAIELEAF